MYGFISFALSSASSAQTTFLIDKSFYPFTLYSLKSVKHNYRSKNHEYHYTYIKADKGKIFQNAPEDVM